MDAALSAFDQAIELLKRTPMPGSHRNRLLTEMSYFKSQALCDDDRRQPDHLLRIRWNGLLSADLKQNGFHLIRENKILWQQLQDFFAFGEGSVPSDHHKPLSVAFGPEDLLRTLEHQLLKKPQMREVEWRLMVLGIIYLHAEAKRPRVHRNDKYLKMVYQWIHPYLKASGVIEPYSGDKNLIKKFRAFLSGQAL